MTYERVHHLLYRHLEMSRPDVISWAVTTHRAISECTRRKQLLLLLIMSGTLSIALGCEPPKRNTAQTRIKREYYVSVR